MTKTEKIALINKINKLYGKLRKQRDICAKEDSKKWKLNDEIQLSRRILLEAGITQKEYDRLCEMEYK